MRHGEGVVREHGFTRAIASCRRSVLVGVSVLLAATSCVPRSAPTVQRWMTIGDRSALLARQPDLTLTPHVDGASSDDDAATVIIVDTAQSFQSIAGFGAAITDASAWLLEERLTPVQREALLQELFGRPGVGLSVARFTIGGSDFSRAHYTLADLAPGASSESRDDSLTRFSLDVNRTHLIPVLRRVRQINPSITFMVTPWSAPAWMKSTGSQYKGTLRKDAYPAFAEYLRRTVADFAAEGIPIDLLSVQNEPHHEPDDYPGMRLNPAQRADFIGEHLRPLFVRRNVGTRILDWDHNWDEPRSPLAVLADTVARRYVAGVAWHCYAGDVAAQSVVHEAHPDKETWFTECAGGSWAPDFGDNLRWNVRTLIIGATRHWARGVILWNLALDESHGPHLGGCTDCRGVVTIHSATGEVTRNEEYYALAHASRFVRPGAYRIASTSGIDDVETVAFRHADNGSLVPIAVNSSTVARTLLVREGARQFRAHIPVGAVVTLTRR